MNNSPGQTYYVIRPGMSMCGRKKKKEKKAANLQTQSKYKWPAPQRANTHTETGEQLYTPRIAVALCAHHNINLLADRTVASLYSE